MTVCIETLLSREVLRKKLSVKSLSLNYKATAALFGPAVAVSEAAILKQVGGQEEEG